MNRYLLFNESCGTCSGIAEQVEKETDGILTGRSLTELEIQILLNEALSEGWEWEPMLMEVSDDRMDVKVYNGVLMRLRLIQLLGIKRAWDVAQIVHRSLKTTYSFQDRRLFLKYTGSTLAGLAVLGLAPVQSGISIPFNSGNSTGTIRELKGKEREAALNKAERNGTFSKFVSFLNSSEYSGSMKGALAHVAEADGYPKVTLVSLSLNHKNDGTSGHIKHASYSGNEEVTMGISVDTGGGDRDVRIYEIVDGSVRHTSTLKLRDGEISKDVVGNSASSFSTSTALDLGPNHSKQCHWCQQVCGWFVGGLCGSIGVGGCILVCVANPICSAICGILFVIFCIWQQAVSCPDFCGPKPKGRGYCP